MGLCASPLGAIPWFAMALLISSMSPVGFKARYFGNLDESQVSVLKGGMSGVQTLFSPGRSSRFWVTSQLWVPVLGGEIYGKIINQPFLHSLVLSLVALYEWAPLPLFSLVSFVSKKNFPCIAVSSVSPRKEVRLGTWSSGVVILNQNSLNALLKLFSTLNLFSVSPLTSASYLLYHPSSSKSSHNFS